MKRYLVPAVSCIAISLALSSGALAAKADDLKNVSIMYELTKSGETIFRWSTPFVHQFGLRHDHQLVRGFPRITCTKGPRGAVTKTLDQVLLKEGLLVSYAPASSGSYVIKAQLSEVAGEQAVPAPGNACVPLAPPQVVHYTATSQPEQWDENTVRLLDLGGGYTLRYKVAP